VLAQTTWKYVNMLTIEGKMHALIKAIQLALATDKIFNQLALATDKIFDRVMFESDFQILICFCSLSLPSLIILYLALKLIYLYIISKF
jgi:hypothetical protein